jgi:hypothetical protein
MTTVRCAATLLIVALTTASSFAQSQPQPSLFIATYFAADGRIVVGTASGLQWRISGLQAQGPAIPFDVDTVKSTLPTDGFVDATEVPNEVSWLFWTPQAVPIELLGVLRPGIPADKLESDYSMKYLMPGSYPLPVDWRYVPVPEASSGVLAGLGSIALWRRLRR